MFDLISIGDSVIDTFIPLTDAEVKTSHGGNERMLCMRFGDKIPVGPSTTLVAGNAANNAVGSARLELKTAIYANVGEDMSGERTKHKFKSEKVDTRYVVVNKGMESNHHVVLNFQGERTILIYHQPWKYNLPDFDNTKWMYLTSLSPSFVESDIYEQIVRYLERTGAKMLFNPGTFQIKVGVKKSPRLLSLTEVFIVNLEEAKLILGHDEADSIPVKKLLQGIADLGPKKVVITDGGEGSYGFDGQEFYKIGIMPAKLVEMTGAGDSYATGVLAGLFHGETLAEAMRWGAANGASVVEHVGPQEGLLTYNQMKHWLKEHSKVTAKEI